jgi:hypothetical protein
MIVTMEEMMSIREMMEYEGIQEMRKVLTEPVPLSEILKNVPIINRLKGFVIYQKIVDRRIYSVNENKVIIEYFIVESGVIINKQEIIVYN